MCTSAVGYPSAKGSTFLNAVRITLFCLEISPKWKNLVHLLSTIRFDIALASACYVKRDGRNNDKKKDGEWMSDAVHVAIVLLSCRKKKNCSIKFWSPHQKKHLQFITFNCNGQYNCQNFDMSKNGQPISIPRRFFWNIKWVVSSVSPAGTGSPGGLVRVLVRGFWLELRVVTTVVTRL